MLLGQMTHDFYEDEWLMKYVLLQEIMLRIRRTAKVSYATFFLLIKVLRTGKFGG